MDKRVYKSRLFIIFIFFISIFTFYATRIIFIQVFRATNLSKLAAKQHNIILELQPERGDILDRNLRKFAVDYNVFSIYAIPNAIRQADKTGISDALCGILDVNRDLVLDRLKKDKSFVWIKREVDRETAESVSALNISGVKMLKEYKRFYPKAALASHVVGFAGLDDSGLEGVELAYDGYLKGLPGWRWTVKDAKRRDIISGDTKLIPASEGLNVILTIDENIQYIAERELDQVFQRYNAKGASVIVMDPHNGDILALANRPTFDLNEFSSSSYDERRNRAVTDIYEPGSVFKIITAASAIESKVADIDQKFFCENGEYKIGGRILHDHKPYGELSFSEIIEKSSNIGVTKIAELLGKDELYKFAKLFGFGEMTGIDMPGEVRGILHHPGKWSSVSISSVPIGQEIAATSIQLARAVAVIANGGFLVKPRVVKEIRDTSGNIIKSFPAIEVRRVISEDTASVMRDILMGVIERGTGKKARLKMYTAAGKTGTAQKVEEGGRYSHSKFIASFLGFAPAVDPKVVILVMVDEPGPVYYGGTVAAPVFGRIAEEVLKYMKVEPDGKRRMESI